MTVDLSPKEVERYEELSDQAREIVETATMRIKLRIESLEVAQRDYNKAHELFLQACVELAEDPFDDFETAYNKACKFHAIDIQHDRASTRLNFERREAAKMGITSARPY